VGFILQGKRKYFNHAKVETIKHGINSWIIVQTYLGVKSFVRARKNTLPKRTKQAIEIISQEIKKINPDIIFLIGFSLNNWYILKAAKNLKIPIVTSHHGLWFKEITSIKGATNNALKIFRRMEKDTTKDSNLEIFLNDYSQKIYSKNLIQTDQKYTRILNLPYSPTFTNKKLPSAPTNKIPKIGMVARWDPIKNPGAFLHIAKLAKQLGKPWKFYLVTKFSNYKQLAHLLPEITKYLTILPEMSPNKLKKFYQSMNLLLLPSHFDTSGFVIMEALLQNRGTIISPHVGWTDEYKKYGAKNWINDFSSAKKSINRIETLLTSPIPKKLVNYIIKYHEPNFIMKQHLALFKQLITK
jgi:glycosyltransferase involved in cell wall biosynthesis